MSASTIMTSTIDKYLVQIADVAKADGCAYRGQEKFQWRSTPQLHAV